MKTSKISYILTTLLFLQGCSVKSLNRDFKNFVDQNYVEQNNSQNYLKNKIKENISKRRYLDLSIKKNISTLLKELSQIDKNSYLFQGEDIEIQSCTNSEKLNINSFKKLNQYIKDTTNMTMVIVKNRFLKNRVKIVKLQDLHSFESDLNNVPFYLKGSVSIDDALAEMSKLTGFSIVYLKDSSSSQNSQMQPNENSPMMPSNSNSFFEGKYTSFSGNNVADFLKLLSNNFNLYVDIDYKNKLIKFSKQKAKIFHVFVNNINMSGSLSGQKNVSGMQNAGGDNLPISSQITINILSDLENNLNKLIQQSSNSILSFNKTSGQIFVKADKRTMENIEKVINDFNAIFNKQIDFELDIYEFAVTKDFTYGVSVGGKITRGKFTYDTEGKMTNELAKSIFKITKKTSNVYAKVESVNNIVQLLQNTSHGYVIKNNMPYMIDLTNSKNYVKTITRTSTITNGVNSETVTPETDTISEGTILTVLPRIVGKRVELNIEPNIVTINKITKETYDGNTISLPDISTNKFKSNITMLDGEKRIIGYITQYQDISDYNGVLPLNHFIIGGENGKKYIRKEIVFVVGVRIKK